MADSRKGHLKKRFCGKTGSVLSMLLMTSTFFLVEIVVGYATNSMALVADSFHMLSDMMSLVIGFFALRYSKQSQRTERNTFGWQRAEVLGALVNAVFLIALCFSILVESLKRIVEPELINNPVLVLIVGAIGLLVNVIGLVLFHRHGHGHSHGGHGHSHGQKNGDLDDIQIELPTAKETNPPVETQWGSAEHDTKIARCSAEIHGARSQSTAVKESKTSDLRPAKREAQDEDSVTKISEDDDVDSVTKISEVERVGDVDCKTKNNSGVPKACAAENRTTTNSKIKSSSQLNMRGVYLHVLGDALGSVIVIISALIIKFASGKWTIYVDPVMSILMVLLILKTSVPLMRESALILLQTVPTHIKIKEVQDRLLDNVDGVLSVHEFHVWQLAGNKIIASAHVTCQSPDDYMNVANNIKRFFHREGIHSTTIQPEFVVGGRKGSECALECGKGDNCAAQKCCPGENEVRKRTLHGDGLESGFNPEGSVVNLGFVADSA